MSDLAIKLLNENKIEYLKNEQMSKHTSFKIGGEADLYVCPKSVEELTNLLEIGKTANLPVTLIGNGSNLLVSDKGIEGLVINTLKMKDIVLISEDEIFAQSGASLTAVCLFALKNGLSGMEFAYGIPGSVGGAVYMNAGAYDGEMKDIVKKVESLNSDLKVVERTSDKLGLGYRESVYKSNGEIITGVTLKLKKGDATEISKKMELLMGKRQRSQPLDFGSAGSTFKRPAGYYAAALIDECGLKGLSVGDAEVSEKHAGFVINKGKATCSDVLKLIEQIKDTVYNQKGVRLDTEVIFIGR